MNLSRLTIALIATFTAVKTHALNIQFKGIEAPKGPAFETTLTQSSKQVTINGQTQPIEYQTLIQTRDISNNEIFGAMKNHQDQIIKTAEGTFDVCNGKHKGKGSGLDHFSILKTNNSLYSVFQFECAVGAMYGAELEQSKDGRLNIKPNTMRFISQKDEFGGWIHCAGQTTPWNSHLGSEEYEPNARPDATKWYFEENAQNYWSNPNQANPYYYGWTPEVKVDSQGQFQHTKHYAMGRFSHELAYVMPDQKTVYLSDDGTNVGLFMFVADKPQDLSSGHLYAARWNQTSNINGGEATLKWLSMGHMDNQSIRRYLDPDNNVDTNDGISFNDIFTTSESLDGQCDSGFKSTQTTTGAECLKLKDINQDGHINQDDITIASRLETRRMAAYLGATTEFRKEEGITFNKRDNTLYIAMSQITKGMEDNSDNDVGGPNHIRLEKNSCGGVYELTVQSDSKIGSEFVASHMKGLIMGQPKNNKCDIDGLANPDNITFIPESNTLIIGEDTSKHLNDAVWAYDLDTRKLTRIATVTYGAETTSPFWHQIGYYGYLTLTTQHPYSEVPKDYAPPKGSDFESKAGYIGPIKLR